MGFVSRLNPVTSRRASPPARATVQMSPPKAKAIRVLLIVGSCNNSGAIVSATAVLPQPRHANNTQKRATRTNRSCMTDVFRNGSVVPLMAMFGRTCAWVRRTVPRTIRRNDRDANGEPAGSAIAKRTTATRKQERRRVGRMPMPSETSGVARRNRGRSSTTARTGTYGTLRRKVHLPSDRYRARSRCGE